MKLVLEGLSATVGPTDGAARYLVGLAGGLGQQPQLELLVIHGPSMQGEIDAGPGAVYRLAGGPERLGRVIAQHRSVPKMARQWGADAVVYTGNFCPVFNGPPSIVVVQNLLLVEETYDFGYAVGVYRRWQAARIARQAVRVVAVSTFLADALLEKFPSIAPKLRVATSGVDERFFIDKAEDASNYEPHPRPYFLCVGTAWPYRDYELAISALAHSQLNHDLVIAGAAESGDRERLLDHARRCGMPGRVVMIGSVDTNRLRATYQAATALVATSRTESFALSILEAMAAGTPVVAVRRTVYPETVSDAGLLCADSPEGLAQGLHEVTDPSTRKALIEKGRHRAASARWTDTAAGILEIARELM